MDKIVYLLKSGCVTFPKALLCHYKELKIADNELIFLIYILNNESDSFDPKKISSELNLSLQEVLLMIDSLSSKDILKIELKKINNIREEFINIEYIYQKLAYVIINGKLEVEEQKTSTIFDLFEQEFGRTLSPMEYEIINGWMDANFNEELIVAALKEATYNGVSNLRYIDKILYEWKKKGYQNKNDVEKNRVQIPNKVSEKKDIFDYNWLDDSDE